MTNLCIRLKTSPKTGIIAVGHFVAARHVQMAPVNVLATAGDHASDFGLSCLGVRAEEYFGHLAVVSPLEAGLGPETPGRPRRSSLVPTAFLCTLARNAGSFSSHVAYCHF